MTQPDSMTTPSLPDEAKRDLDQSRQAIRREVDDAKSRTSQAATTLREETNRMGETMKTKAREEADRRKNETAGYIDDFANAVRHAADDLAERDQSTASRFVQEAAGGLESVSRSIRTHSIEDMARTVSRFGRERPATFLAGAVLAGIAIGRFVKASAERTDYGDDDAQGSGPPYGMGKQAPAGAAAASASTGTKHPAASGDLASPYVSTRSTAVLGEPYGNR